MHRTLIGLFLAGFLLLPFCPLWLHAQTFESAPLRWGFDDIGVRGPGPVNQGNFRNHPHAAEILREFGFDLWVTWYPDNAHTWTYAENLRYISELDAFCDANEIHWMPNPLQISWSHAPKTAIDSEGFDWFNRPDGRRFYLWPDPLLAELGRCKRLLGVLYDEPEHHQGSAHVVQGYDLPHFYDPRGDAVLDAASKHTSAASEVVALYGKHGINLYTEQVFPVMYHNFARAGLTAGTKVLKEHWSPVAMACAMGAAWQYDTEFWVSPDLWGTGGYPGHTPEEYRSALLLAYHLGADCIYTESLALDAWGGIGPQHSLIKMTESDYEITEYGEVARWFRQTYVPTHPRDYRLKDLRPSVVIIRQEDGYWGQDHLPPGSDWVRPRLYGHPEWKITGPMRAWLDIWHLLSDGVIPRDGLSWWTSEHKGRPYQVLCPLPGVIVLDERATDEHLQFAELIFLTGTALPKTAVAAVRRRVSEGAICVTLPHLTPGGVLADAGSPMRTVEGDGVWIVTDSFLDDRVREAVASWIPTKTVLTYRFKDTKVSLTARNNNPNDVTATVTKMGTD